MKECDDDISKVHASDTVDFGTFDFGSTKKTILSYKDDGTQSESYSSIGDNEDGLDGDDQHVSQRPRRANHDIDNTIYQYMDRTLFQQYSNYLENNSDPTIIDNRKLVYIPIRLACGVCAYCSPDVLKHCPMVLRSIQADLTRAFSVLPKSVHSLLRRTNLWLNYNGYAYGPKANPRILRHVTCHHHPAWLVEWALDTPQKAMGIEIYSCLDFQAMRLHWNGSGLLLHEFCHLIHQCCLEDGLENHEVEVLYEKADASGNYQKVLRRDWAGKSTRTTAATMKRTSTSTSLDQDQEQFLDSDLAYAMVDPKEFFAELSVAYFSNAYRSLDRADPKIMEACSPPLLHPVVAKRIENLVLQRKRERLSNNSTESFHGYTSGGNVYHSLENTDGDAIHHPERMDNIDDFCCFAPFLPVKRCVKNLRRRGRLFLALQNGDENDEDPQLARWQTLTDPVFRETAMSRNCANIYHCNKFYPFTRGQLKHHDPELFENLRDLWREISRWEDPFASLRTRKRQTWEAHTRRCTNLVISDC